MAAANGTADDANCRTTTGARIANSTNACTSRWGAHDMIGNFWEWTADWDGTPHDNAASLAGSPQWFPTDEYNLDTNIAQHGFMYSGEETEGVNLNSTTVRSGMFVAIARGGSWQNGNAAGVFASHSQFSPAGWMDSIGFRCMIPR